MTTKRETRIRAMIDSPAGPPTEVVLADCLFGSAATVTEEVQGEVPRLKPEVIALFLGRHAQSQHPWERS